MQLPASAAYRRVNPIVRLMRKFARRTPTRNVCMTHSLMNETYLTFHILLDNRSSGKKLELVPLAGIEPPLLAELDFESSASTSSATGALETPAALKV